MANSRGSVNELLKRTARSVAHQVVAHDAVDPESVAKLKKQAELVSKNRFNKRRRSPTTFVQQD